jgi:hypothetical protein
MIKPHIFAQNVFYLNGAPLRMPVKSMKHLYPIYDRPSSSTILKFGRQTHKSTTLAYKLALPSIKYSNYNALYVAPTGNQVSVFSSDKLNAALHESDVIKEHFFDTKTKDQVSYKEMRNNSKIYLRSAFHSADAIRGISADMSMIDEVQDIVSDHIPVIEQCMSHSLAKWEHLKERFPTIPMHLFNCRMYAGTPKTVENTMETYWEKSTKNEFLIKCQHAGCMKWNYINEYNIGDTCLICNKCSKPIFYRHGQWVSMSGGADIDGYRLPQIVLPWINNETNPRAWQINVIQPRGIYSAEKYFNEVLALPYAAARHPISDAEIRSCCDEELPMITEDQAKTHPLLRGCLVTAGIDWGKGDTASGTSYSTLDIGVWSVKGKYITVFKKRYTGRMSEALRQVEDMIRIIRAFNATLTIADTGDGRTSNAMMVEALGAQHFAEVYEHGTIRQKIKWEKEKGIYIFNRTRVMTDVIMEIKKAKVGFFSYDQFKEFKPDYTGIYAEYSEQTRMTKYDHNVPDDSFHSGMFARVACGIIRGEYARHLSGGESTTGENDHGISVGSDVLDDDLGGMDHEGM